MTEEGFYLVEYFAAGPADNRGFGIMALDRGMVVGADWTGGVYDGAYKYNPKTELLDFQMKGTIPAGVLLVQGLVSPPGGMTLRVAGSLPRELSKAVTIDVATSAGPVQARFQKIREFPAD